MNALQAASDQARSKIATDSKALNSDEDAEEELHSKLDSLQEAELTEKEQDKLAAMAG